MLDPNAMLEAEIMVLGSCLMDADAAVTAVGALRSDMFLNAEHAGVFEALAALLRDGKPADPALVAQRAGQDVVARLMRSSYSSRNVGHYVELVRGFWDSRRLYQSGAKIQGIAQHGGTAGDAMAVLMALDDGEETAGFVEPRPRMRAVVDYIDERFKAGDRLIGHSTGFADLDAVLSGWRDGCLYIVAGRPAMGKTAFALCSVLPTAEAGFPVLFFSMEMPTRELDLRLVSCVGRINQEHVQHAKFTDDEWARFTASATQIERVPILIDDTPARTLASVVASVKREGMKRGKIGAVVIDYIGLMRGDGENRSQEVGQISRGLKALAKEMQCPVIALSQLNRKCEDRTDKRPMMSDLRDSGDVEQDADAVIMLYRDHVYNPESALSVNKVAEFLVRKNRHGEVKEVRVIDDLVHARFLNADKSIYSISNQVKNNRSGGYE